MYSTTGSALSSDEIAFAQRVAASFHTSMQQGWIKIVRQVDPATNAIVEYHSDKNIAYVTPGGVFLVFDELGGRFVYDAVKDKITAEVPIVDGSAGGYQVEASSDVWFDAAGQVAADSVVAHVFDSLEFSVIGVSVYKGVIYCVYADVIDDEFPDTIYPASETGFDFDTGRRLLFSKLQQDDFGVWSLVETKEYAVPVKAQAFLGAITYYTDGQYWANAISFSRTGQFGVAFCGSRLTAGVATNTFKNPSIMVPANRWIEEARYLMRVDCEAFDISFEEAPVTATETISQTGINTRDGVYHRGNSRQHFSFIQGIVVFTTP